MRILIAGGCGFVGSSLAVYLKIKYPKYKILVYDNLIRRGSALNISRLRDLGIVTLKGDVRNRTQVEALPQIDLIIDAAAEPSVLSGINNDPTYVIETNFGGTLNLVRLAIQHQAILLFLSTSRVYPFNQLNRLPYREKETRYEFDDTNNEDLQYGISSSFSTDGLKSFYGASKLAAENMIREYAHFYDLPAIINRFGVIAGPYQMGKVDQGILVHWVASHFFRKPLSYLGFGGSGKQVRDILHIHDMCELIDIQIHAPAQYLKKIWNIGGGRKNTTSLLELTSLCQNATGNRLDMKQDVQTRPADVRIYCTDNRNITEVSGWTPRRSVKDCVEDTISWIRSNQTLLEPILS